MSSPGNPPAWPDLDELSELVRAAAREELLPRFADVLRHIKHDGSVVTAADHAMQDRLQAELARRWPEYAFLGEEMSGADHERLIQDGAPGLWCLDPLDGTTNYAAGLPFFGVSLALLVPDGPALGLVYDPLRDECFAARREAGARLNGAPLRATARAPELRRCVAVVDFKRLPRELARELGAHPPYGSQRNFGACSLEWCWLAAERFHIYLHGGQKLWDYAAGSLILKEAGARAATLADEEVFAFALAPRSVVAAVDPEIFAQWRTWLAARLVHGG
ncbi:inositol monophosphatase [Sulfurifustis variabilis]|uniref:Inositol monophosphatase n=1 Tax=Sulfurifustis variabilis TaxID=1675686 RepID=A0A1C7AFE2_9GAMM|nr:inositol monophosphatase [Sulfurifustis variabilis]BAU50022.1 inositol monophosphatase [Sulfurifustis variabilis]